MLRVAPRSALLWGIVSPRRPRGAARAAPIRAVPIDGRHDAPRRPTLHRTPAQHFLHAMNATQTNRYLASAIAAVAFSLASCGDPCDSATEGGGFFVCDECADVVCENGGVCVEGICDCAAGYEGDRCTDESRVNLIGSYAVFDRCSRSRDSEYNVNISNSSTGVSGVSISGFWGTFVNDVTAMVNGTDIIILDQEPDGDGFTVSGNGTYTDGSISLNFTVSDGELSDVCQSEMTKLEP